MENINKKTEHLEKEAEKLEYDPEYQLIMIRSQLSEELRTRMEEDNISIKELSDNVLVSEDSIEAIINEDEEKCVDFKDIVKIFSAWDYKINIQTERHSKYNAQFWHDQLYNATNNIYAETYTESELVTLYQVCDWLKDFFGLKEYKTEHHSKFNGQFWYDQLYNAANNIYAETYTESELVTLYKVCGWLKDFFDLKEYKGGLDKKRI